MPKRSGKTQIFLCGKNEERGKRVSYFVNTRRRHFYSYYSSEYFSALKVTSQRVVPPRSKEDAVRRKDPRRNPRRFLPLFSIPVEGEMQSEI